jgi:Rieske Fe-S protein
MTDRHPTGVSSPATPRRTFLNVILGGGAVGLLGSIFYPILQFVLPPKLSEAVAASVVAAKADELAPGTGKIFKFGTKPGLLVRLSSGDYKAFSAVCTHLQCTVQYQADLAQIWCACHNGHFNLNGEVLAGPPPAPLDAYKVSVRGDEIVVSKV